MADRLPDRAPREQGMGDEAAHVLKTLQELIDTVTSPVIRACLEEAHADIAHLTGPEDPPAAGNGHHLSN